MESWAREAERAASSEAAAAAFEALSAASEALAASAEHCAFTKKSTSYTRLFLIQFHRRATEIRQVDVLIQLVFGYQAPSPKIVPPRYTQVQGTHSGVFHITTTQERTCPGASTPHIKYNE